LKELRVANNSIYVKFSVDKKTFSALVRKIRTMKCVRFDKVAKEWIVPDNLENRKVLHMLGFSVSVENDIDKVYPEPQKDFDISVLSQLPHTLRDYQIQAVKFAEASDWNCIIAMAPRLGKTIVSLLGAKLHNMFPVLIVCPAVSKLMWQRAISEWFGETSTVIYGMTPYKCRRSNYIVINYDLLSSWEEVLAISGFRYMIVDESHRVGNTTIYTKKANEDKGHLDPVKVTSAFMHLASVIPNRALLSGTPATSSVAQLQPQLGIFIPRCSNKWWFLWHFCDPQIGYGGRREYKGFSNKDEFRKLVAPVIFRRTKQDVFSELPDETHEFVDMDIDSSLYAEEIHNLHNDAEKQHLTEEQIDERIGRFKSLSYTAKRSQIFQWIDNFLEVNNKLVVFCWYQAVADDLLKHFGKIAVMVNGTVTAVKRQHNIDAFNSDPKIKLFIGQISAVKESISLAAADSVFFVEFGTANAGSVIQASERIWLPELKQKKLCYYYAVGKDSIEEQRIKILQERYKMLSSALDGKNTKQTFFGRKLSDII
jgi:SWI/SNF-related matrix-associated actin-dependent regulator of chromatin subfamily A-like protein 1